MSMPTLAGGATSAGESSAEIDPRVTELDQDTKERLAWRKNAPVLYDLLVDCALEWPALSVAWLPDEPDEGCRLALGTHTDGSIPNEVIVAELRCTVESQLSGDPWQNWDVEGLGEAEGFGCVPTDDGGPFQPVSRMQHPTEVNRIAPCPHRPQLLATKAATGAVFLFDYKAERSASAVSPDATLVMPGDGADGFALAWSGPQKNILASGGHDGRLCIWDVNVAPKARASSPLHNFVAHSGAVCDLGFMCSKPGVLASVGDDKTLRLWDARSVNQEVVATVSSDEVLSVDWNAHQDHTLATSGKDREVRVWDLRYLGTPLHTLRGHKGDVVAVQWAPQRETVLASCSSDSRLIIWDLAPKTDQPEQPDDEMPELLFAHGGHVQAVSDFAWSEVDDYLMCSVASDNSFQVWQPSTFIYLADSDAESEPSAKRLRANSSG